VIDAARDGADRDEIAVGSTSTSVNAPSALPSGVRTMPVVPNACRASAARR
jgi:hypothetical protein